LLGPRRPGFPNGHDLALLPAAGTPNPVAMSGAFRSGGPPPPMAARASSRRELRLPRGVCSARRSHCSAGGLAKRAHCLRAGRPR
jgi:hypothetical protein